MTKPTIKVGFVDYFNPVDEFFTEILSEDFEVIRDDANPDYLFFCDETFGQRNLQYDAKKVIKIFYTGENRRASHYLCHFGITFDHLEGQQYFRLPLYALENWVNQKKLGWPDIREKRIRNQHIVKEGFCSFVVRNGGCQERNEIFHLLNSYKTVDSGGPLFNNVGGPIDQAGFNSHITKTEFIRKRKFHIAYENSSYPGYVTEKILHGFLGDSIPIYWGSPTVAMDFNPDAFISRHNFDSTEEMLDYIVQVDKDDKLYTQMMCEPIFNRFNLQNRFLDFNKFRYWFRMNVWPARPV